MGCLKLFRSVLVLGLLGMLAACASKQEPPPPNVVVSARQCAPSLDLSGASALAYDPAKEKSTTVVIDDSAQCMQDASGAKSVYHVFVLPAAAQPYLITVASIPWAGTIFAPRALLTDSKGSVQRTTTHADFAFRGDVLSTILRSHPKESYLVVASDPEIAGQVYSRLNGNTQQNLVAAYPAMIMVYTGSETSTARTFALGGKITVTLGPIVTK